DEKWTVYPIGEEPTVHRMRFAELDDSGKPYLIVAPLMGRNSTKEANWMDGSPVRILAYKIPKDPIKHRWVPEVLDESLHVVHNFWYRHFPKGRGAGIYTASYEGLTTIATFRERGTWERRLWQEGNQANPKGSRGCSEVKIGRTGDKTDARFVATIEPWHGNQVVVYTRDSTAPGPKFRIDR